MTSSQRKYAFNGRAFLSDSDIKDSRIINCDITALRDPIYAGDAVSLAYLNTSLINNNYNVINIQGAEWFELDLMPPFGNRNISISCTQSGGPNAAWRVSKSSESDEPFITNLAFSPSSDGGVFEISWMPNTALQIRKSTTNWDGRYEISVQR